VSKYWLYLKYLFIPSVFFLVAGLVAQAITNQSAPLYLGLITAGATLLIVWLASFLFINKAFWLRRSTQTNANILLSSLAFLVILVLLNYLAFRYSYHIDLTKNQLHTLAPQSQEILKNLPQNTKAYVFLRAQPDPDDRELLNSYAHLSPNFQFEFVDPEIRPALARQFAVKSLGSVYLQYADKKLLVQNLQLDPKGQTLDRISEVKLTSTLERIVKNSQQTIYILQGHQEPSLLPGKDSISEAVAILKDKGYIVKALNLAQEAKFPKDINSLLIIGPKKKLLKPEADLIKQYSDQGGNVLLLVDPWIDPGLDLLLDQWGVKLDPRLVVDASVRGSQIGVGPESPVIFQYGEHPITKPLQNGNSIFPLTRAIGTIKVKEVQANPLLITDNKTWASASRNSDKITFNPRTDLAGPFDIGVALKRKLKENKESKLVVVGNSTFATNGWFTTLLDGDFFINSVQWLNEGDQANLSIRARESQNRRIVLTSAQFSSLFWLSILLFPLLGLILAIASWWKRR